MIHVTPIQASITSIGTAGTGGAVELKNVTATLEEGGGRMGSWRTRLRGVFGLGLVGGVVGALFGGLWWVASSVLGLGSVDFGTVWWAMALWGGFGAFAASGAGLLLTALGSRQTLEELSAWRVGAFGAVMGFVAPVAFIFVMTGGFSEPMLGLVAAASGALGGLLGGGLVLTAKRAPSELPPGGSASGLAPGEGANG